MALVIGTNSGFVTVAPSTDPDGFGAVIDDQAHVTKDTSPASAVKITEIGWYCNNASNESNFEVGLYAADGAVVPGEAGTLLHVSRTNAKGTGIGWKVVTGLDWAISSSTDYWIGVQLDNTTSTGDDYATSGGTGADMLFGSPTELPDPFGGGAILFGSGMFAFYAVWEESGVNITISPSAEALNLTLQVPAIDSSTTFEPPAETLSLTLQTPTIDSSTTLEPSALALTLIQQTPDIIIDKIISPSALSLSLTLPAPTLSWSSSVSPSAQALALTLQTPNVGSVTVFEPDTFTLSLTSPTPTVSGTALISPSAVALTSSLKAPDVSGTANIYPSALALTLSQKAPTISGTALVTPSAQTLTLTQQTPTVSGTANVFPSALSLALSLKAPTISGTALISPSALALNLTLLNPSAGTETSETFLASVLELNLNLYQAVGGETGGYEPLHTPWGFQDERASAKATGFSLFWKGHIVDEEHYEPHLSEYSGISTNLAEMPERVIPTRGQTGPDVNAPLTPLLPHIKRNKDNHLEKFLEGKTLHNKTLFTRRGLKGARFGEGIDSGEGLLKKWKESQQTKC